MKSDNVQIIMNNIMCDKCDSSYLNLVFIQCYVSKYGISILLLFMQS